MRGRLRRYFAAVWLALSLALAATTAQAELVTVRVAWGTGEASRWQGTIRIDQGRITSARGLGLSADAPGSIFIRNATTVVVDEAGPQSYDGVDLQIDAPLNATLTVDLKAGEANNPVQVQLGDLVKSPQGKEQALDRRGNRVLLQRAPGDLLRFETEREHLVFATGEVFAFSIQPHLISGAANTGLQCRARLLDDELIEYDEQEEVIQLDQIGESKPVNFRFVLPQREGVYDIEITLQRRRRVPFNIFPAALPSRRVQLVVLDQKPPAADAKTWSNTTIVYPAGRSESWSKWFARLPGINQIPGFDVNAPLDNGLSKKERVGGLQMTQLEPGGWVAYPLSIPEDQLHRPHILEVDYPNDIRQTMCVSVLEMNRGGAVTPIAVDTGVDVDEPAIPEFGQEPKLNQHRVVFWPRTNNPLILIANHRVDQPALFHSIRLVGGRDRLEPAQPPVGDDQRLLAAYLDEPHFPENFGADEARDPSRPPHGTLDDWHTFYRGAARLVEYLKYAGYNGAVICVAREGGAIYPSQRLLPTPRYDSGVFFRNGQDPLRKDVLEMLFRLFDREGLRLVPALHLSGTIPALERIRRAGMGKTGVALIGPNGRSRFAGSAGGAFYNPLDPQVQAELRRVVVELTDRYSQHRSFDGLALQLTPDASVQLPDQAWGVDPTTVGRFLTDTNTAVPTGVPADHQANVRFVTDKGRDAWRSWRALKLAQFHRDIYQDVSRRQPAAKLILAGADMFRWPTLQNGLRPTLPATARLNELCLRVGLNPKEYARIPNISLLRPYRLAPVTQVADQETNLTLNQSLPGDDGFGGSLFFHERRIQPLRGFEKLSPFGADRTHKTELYARFAPGNAENRRRFIRALASRDDTVILDGGGMLPLGQEDANRRLLRMIRSLPAQQFTDAVAAKTEDGSSVTVRSLQSRGTQYVYALNRAPWSMTVRIEIDSAGNPRMRPLLEGDPGELKRIPNGRYEWLIQLPPFGMAATTFAVADAQVVDWSSSTPPRVTGVLEQRMQFVQARIEQVRKSARVAASQPMNLDFSVKPVVNDPVPGWELPQRTGMIGEVVGDAMGNALHLENRTSLALWCRSSQFRTPRTGMLAVVVRMKVKDEEKQPDLAVVLDDTSRGFYDPIWIGQQGSAKLTTEWKEYPFLFHVPPDLPHLELGFDIYDKGEVWIDEIKIYDIWMEFGAATALTVNGGMARRNLRKGRPYQCQEFLESFWSRFFHEHDPTRVRLAARDDPPPPPQPNGWDRVKKWIPQWPPLRFGLPGSSSEQREEAPGAGTRR